MCTNLSRLEEYVLISEREREKDQRGKVCFSTAVDEVVVAAAADAVSFCSTLHHSSLSLSLSPRSLLRYPHLSLFHTLLNQKPNSLGLVKLLSLPFFTELLIQRFGSFPLS